MIRTLFNWRVLLLVALTLLFFYKLAFTDLILARGDTYAYFYPLWDARNAALAQGQLPLWSPDLFMGTPLLANSQLGTLYPPNWLTVPFNAPDAIRISIVLHGAWAAIGAFALARVTLRLTTAAAVVAAVIYAFGGHVGAHVEQINQLQGLAWMPWLFLLLHQVLTRSWRWGALMGVAWGFQLLCGHTQTVFITGVGLGVYAFGWGVLNGDDRRLQVTAQSIGIVGGAALLAVVIALPQLIPTQELVSVSNRGDGLNAQEATAFSFEPMMLGRGLLPSYVGQPFGEYVAYLGVIGLGLAVIGIFASSRMRWAWLALIVLGVFLAFGRFNPVYMLLAELPGFNLFRVPARWLALWSLGGAMLAGLGAQHVLDRQAILRSVWGSVLGVIALLAGLAFLADRAVVPPVAEPQIPATLTLVAWAVAVGTLVFVLWQTRLRALLPLLVIAELWLASQALPFNDMTDPAVYEDARFTIRQLQAYGEDDLVPGRFLSISNLRFNPGDEPVLRARWARMGLSERAAQIAFTAVKMQDTAVGNLPLAWGIPTIDGFDGGVLPTQYYTAFTSLLLPAGTLRTVDGRLREVLAQDACRGACRPYDRWLDLTNTQYLVVDKVFDTALVHDGIFFDGLFDTSLEPETPAVFLNEREFVGDEVQLLYACIDACTPPRVQVDDVSASLLDADITVDALQLARYTVDRVVPDMLSLTGADGVTVVAVAWVDSRTNDFVPLTPVGWQRVYSGDVKIYENLDVMPRAFLVDAVTVFPDTWDGTEQALDFMRDPAFNPREMAVINTGDPAIQDFVQTLGGDGVEGQVTIVEYMPTRVVLDVQVDEPAVLILTDAYYPGWQVDSGALYRGNVMFRAVPVIGSGRVIVSF